MQDVSVSILSEITTYMKYARYLPEKQRRETWEEIVERNMSMHMKRFPQLSTEIRGAYAYVRSKKVVPSMRSMQFAGRAIEANNARMYNCSFLPIDDVTAFSEIFFLLLGGTGVGFSVQEKDVSQLPPLLGEASLREDERPRDVVVQDSIEGWADSVGELVRSFFFGERPVRFDYSEIRPKGSPLVTTGGKAPGPGPLTACHTAISRLLRDVVRRRGAGTKLRPIEVHDIVCHIADAVLAGGIRRAALISLFSPDDTEMLEAKSGPWWEKHPERARANNSVVIDRSRVTREEFDGFWDYAQRSGSGEPGIFFTNDPRYGANPCVEISLQPFQFCNLTEINVSNVEDQQDLEHRARAAAFIGTLQAAYTDFHYIREIWKRTTEAEALLGVSMTGIASGKVLELDLERAARAAVDENRKIAGKIGIRPAARVTAVKPSGTTSLALGTSSGIHPWHNDYFIRRIRVGKSEPIYAYLAEHHPELVEDERFRPDSMAVISVPVKAPDGAILRTESPLDTLKRVKHVQKHWIRPGHIEGPNTHNVSVTVNVRDHEWDEVGRWMWENREWYNGITVFPHDGGTYEQAPFEDITREEYREMVSRLRSIDLTQISEEEDNTALQGEVACSAGSCEITGSTNAESMGA
ncbi:MAG: hypothetical protein ACLFM6_10095 [Spirochaetaceae bacterium]